MAKQQQDDLWEPSDSYLVHAKHPITSGLTHKTKDPIPTPQAFIQFMASLGQNKRREEDRQNKRRLEDQILAMHPDGAEKERIWAELMEQRLVEDRQP